MKSLRKRGDESWKAWEALKQVRKEIEIKGLQMGALLWYFRKNNRYKDILGFKEEEGATWNTFLLQPELSVKASTAAHLMQAYRVFKEELQLPDEELAEIPQYKLLMIAPHITEENKENMLENAKELSPVELSQYILAEVKNVDIEHCVHERVKILNKCLDCKSFIIERNNKGRRRS